jgi:fibronectin type 3 domain-containing protein
VDLPPTRPGGLEVTAVGGFEVSMKWQPNTEPDLEGYRILMNDTGANASGPFKTAASVGSSTTEYTVIRLAEKTTYHFAVIAFDAVPSDSGLSNIVSATTKDETGPGSPSGLNAEALSASEIKLTWSANTEPDVAGYLIYMNDTGNNEEGNYHLVHKLVGTETTWTVAGLGDDTQYHFRLRAFDEIPHNSTFSEHASATTDDATPPSEPTGLVVESPTTSSLTVKWDANTDHDITGYYLYRSESKTGTFTSVSIDMITSTSIIDEKLEENTVYYYRLKAIDDADLMSDYSDVVYGTTLLGPKAPKTNLTKFKYEIPEDTYDDTTIDLYEWFIDENNDALRFECTGQVKIGVTIYQENGTVVLRPEQNWNGHETLSFSAYDATEKAKIPVIITVTPINDAPYDVNIKSPADGHEIMKGENLVLQGSGQDPDLDYGDELTYQWFSDIDGKIGEGINLTIRTLSADDHTITLKISDKDGLSAEDSITITVQDKNGGPGSSGTGDESADNKGLMIAAAGIAVAVVMVIIILFFIMRRNKKRRELEKAKMEEQEEEPVGPPDQEIDASFEETAEHPTPQPEEGQQYPWQAQPGEPVQPLHSQEPVQEPAQYEQPQSSGESEDVGLSQSGETESEEQGATANGVDTEPEVQLVPCPTCGNQISVNTTPCPHCNTTLNWGS